MTSIVFKTIGELEQRGMSKCIDVLTSDHLIRQLYTDVEAHYVLLQQGQFLKASKANVSCTKDGQLIIRLTTQSVVYRGRVFDTQCDALDAFVNAATVSVCDALKKEPYERFSIKGTLVNVSPLKETPRSKRKEVELQDVKDRNKIICVTLWRDSADVESPVVDSTIIIKNVYSKSYQNVLTFNSTQQTRMEVLDSETTDEIIIDGFIEGDDGLVHLDTDIDVGYKVDCGLLLGALEIESLDDLQAALPLPVVVKYMNVTKSITEFIKE